jgi:hypothetical protein
MKKLLATTALVALVTGFSGFAHAQTAMPTTNAPVVAPNGVNEVDQRLNNQQQRIDNGVKDGQINSTQEMHDDKADAHVSQELSKDEAKNGGTITKREQAKMNKQLNKNSHRIHHQRVKGSKAVTPAPVSAQ